MLCHHAHTPCTYTHTPCTHTHTHTPCLATQTDVDRERHIYNFQPSNSFDIYSKYNYGVQYPHTHGQYPHTLHSWACCMPPHAPLTLWSEGVHLDGGVWLGQCVVSLLCTVWWLLCGGCQGITCCTVCVVVVVVVVVNCGCCCCFYVVCCGCVARCKTTLHGCMHTHEGGRGMELSELKVHPSLYKPYKYPSLYNHTNSMCG